MISSVKWHDTRSLAFLEQDDGILIAFTCLEHHQRYGGYFVVVKREAPHCHL